MWERFIARVNLLLGYALCLCCADRRARTKTSVWLMFLPGGWSYISEWIFDGNFMQICTQALSPHGIILCLQMKKKELLPIEWMGEGYQSNGPLIPYSTFQVIRTMVAWSEWRPSCPQLASLFQCAFESLANWCTGNSINQCELRSSIIDLNSKWLNCATDPGLWKNALHFFRSID